MENTTGESLIKLLQNSDTARISMGPGLWASWDKGEGKWEIYLVERKRVRLYGTADSIEEMISTLKEAANE